MANLETKTKISATIFGIMVGALIGTAFGIVFIGMVGFFEPKGNEDMADYMVSVDGGEEMAITASNQAAARNYAVREKVKVRVMKPADYMALGKSGGSLIVAGEDAQPEPAPAAE